MTGPPGRQVQRFTRMWEPVEVMWATTRVRTRLVLRSLRRHPFRTVAAAAVVAAASVLLVAFAWIRWSTSGRIYRVDDVPKAPVAIVFGAGLQPDGTPTPYLTARLRDGATLYRTGKVKVILVTGDNSRKDHDEVGAMHAWLTAHGVPAAKVVEDHAGFDTYDSCQRARQIFGVDDAIAVTQGFHIRRAVFLCQQAGIHTVGVASVAHGGSPAMNEVRELPAGVKAMFDAIVDPGPKYLGPKEHGIQAALASS